MRARHVAYAVGALVVGLPAAIIAVDAAVRWHPNDARSVATRVNAAADLDVYLSAREDSVAGVKPAARKTIAWQDAKTKARTPIALVYLHGFSATRHELSPTVERLADSLHANAFFTRLAAHGLVDGEAFASVTPQQWVDDAREALAIGRRIGERVVVIGTSTGAALAMQLAIESGDSAAPAALIMVSPNHAPADPRAQLLAGPFGPRVARLIAGRYRGFTPSNAAHAELWTSRIRSEGLAAMMDLVRHAGSIDVSRIRVPLLTLYTHLDDVVDIGLIRSRHAAFGSPVKQVVDVPEATRHEMASAALGPQAVDPVVRLMLGFIRRALPMS